MAFRTRTLAAAALLGSMPYTSHRQRVAACVRRSSNAGRTRRSRNEEVRVGVGVGAAVVAGVEVVSVGAAVGVAEATATAALSVGEAEDDSVAAGDADPRRRCRRRCNDAGGEPFVQNRVIPVFRSRYNRDNAPRATITGASRIYVGGPKSGTPL